MVKILKDLFPNDGTGRGHVGMEAGLRSEGRKKKVPPFPVKTPRHRMRERDGAQREFNRPPAFHIARKKGLSQPNNATYRPRI
jgi:hypothetical protein